MAKDFDYEKDDQTFLHCKNCLDKFLGSPTHNHISPADFLDYCASAYPYTFEDGTTERVFVLWCKHCKLRVWDSRHLIPRTSDIEAFRSSGGKARAAKLSSERRKEIAAMGGKAKQSKPADAA
jgi:hypothetical protein